MQRDNDAVSWARFVRFIILRLGPTIRINSLAELKDLHRTDTLDEYQRPFLGGPLPL